MGRKERRGREKGRVEGKERGDKMIEGNGSDRRGGEGWKEEREKE